MKITLVNWISFLIPGAGMLGCSSKAVETKRPNIVIIMADDHAFQALSAYSDELNEKYLKSYLEHMARSRR